MSDQYEMAERLINEMEVAGDLEEQIRPADMLDSLACAGLELAEGPAASLAYLALAGREE